VNDFAGEYGDVPAGEAREALRRAAELAADYLERVGDRPVLARTEPGDLLAALPASPPEHGETFEAIFEDWSRRIEPALTHWNHPGFFAYFAITGSVPGIAADTLAAAANVNAMLWRTSPAATELEELTCDWLRQMLDLPPAFRGHINDTASISTLLALAAARHRALPSSREQGLCGAPQPVVYASVHAHSSVDKAAMTLGLGLAGVRHVSADPEFRMDPEALLRLVREDRAAGRLPIAVVATAGTTSTTSVDPLRPIAELCAAEGLWLHVDAAYAGSAAICPEHRAALDGLELADSVVVNPHKWLFVPFDCSVLYTRGYAPLRDAFSLVPAYLRTEEEPEVLSLMDLGVQLGRRFRALKLWMVIRRFGVEGLRRRIRAHCELAAELAGLVAAEPGFELAAPVPFSVVCFRALPEGGAADGEAVDRLNQELLRRINADGRAFLSHTELHGRIVLRWAIGNLRTTRERVLETWELVRGLAAAIRCGQPAERGQRAECGGPAERGRPAECGKPA
jgi:aromatic-L-amino-acid decarboxylase